jgi:hypothetical protein
MWHGWMTCWVIWGIRAGEGPGGILIEADDPRVYSGVEHFYVRVYLRYG